MNPQPITQPVAEEAQSTTADPTLLESVIDTTAELQRLRYEEARFTFQQRRAKLFAASGLFAQKDLDRDTAVAQAMVRIELGESMGISPAESLQGIYIINGQTAVSSAVRAARMQTSGYSWEIEWCGTEEECTGCKLWLYYRGKPITDSRTKQQATVSFLKRDAEKMLTTLWEDSKKRRASILEKDNWKMSPRNMYFARAITNAQRFYAPAVLSANLLSVEEALDFPVEEPAQREETPKRKSARDVIMETPSFSVEAELTDK